MKKLMIAAAIVCAAAFAQAASVDWQVTKQSFTGYGKAPTDKDRYSGITSYLLVFDTTAAAAQLYTDLTAGSVTFQQAIDTYSVGSAQGNTSTSSKSAGAIATTLSSGKLTAGDPYYFAMFSIGDADHFLLSKETTGTPYASEPDEGSAAIFASANFSTSADVRGGWTAVNVPEPTSAMLLLLGVAGLALKRKRA